MTVENVTFKRANVFPAFVSNNIVGDLFGWFADYSHDILIMALKLAQTRRGLLELRPLFSEIRFHFNYCSNSFRQV